MKFEVVDNGIVPIGKYRGRPVAEMARDTSYMEWLQAQPFFDEKFGHFFSLSEQEKNCTPDHNRLQALFLEDKYVAAFLKAAKVDKLILDLGNKIERHAQMNVDCYKFSSEKRKELEEKIKNPHFQMSWDVAFEYQMKRFSHDVCIRYKLLHDIEWCSFTKNFGDGFDCVDVLIEIKPTVADDYPVVLRQMAKSGAKYLFLVEYVGVGATKEQFIKIFEMSGMTVVFKDDVDALL